MRVKIDFSSAFFNIVLPYDEINLYLSLSMCNFCSFRCSWEWLVIEFVYNKSTYLINYDVRVLL